MEAKKTGASSLHLLVILGCGEQQSPRGESCPLPLFIMLWAVPAPGEPERLKRRNEVPGGTDNLSLGLCIWPLRIW